MFGNITENGNLFQVTEFKNKDANYLLKHYDAEGNMTVKNGNGFIEEKYSSEKPKEKNFYKNGLLEGEYKYWNANGSLRKLVNISGMKDGEWMKGILLLTKYIN